VLSLLAFAADLRYFMPDPEACCFAQADTAMTQKTGSVDKKEKTKWPQVAVRILFRRVRGSDVHKFFLTVAGSDV
jgi:hypothetical protein